MAMYTRKSEEAGTSSSMSTLQQSRQGAISRIQEHNKSFENTHVRDFPGSRCGQETGLHTHGFKSAMSVGREAQHASDAVLGGRSSRRIDVSGGVSRQTSWVTMESRESRESGQTHSGVVGMSREASGVSLQCSERLDFEESNDTFSRENSICLSTHGEEGVAGQAKAESHRNQNGNLSVEGEGTPLRDLRGIFSPRATKERSTSVRGREGGQQISTDITADSFDNEEVSPRSASCASPLSSSISQKGTIPVTGSEDSDECSPLQRSSGGKRLEFSFSLAGKTGESEIDFSPSTRGSGGDDDGVSFLTHGGSTKECSMSAPKEMHAHMQRSDTQPVKSCILPAKGNEEDLEQEQGHSSARSSSEWSSGPTKNLLLIRGDRSPNKDTDVRIASESLNAAGVNALPSGGTGDKEVSAEELALRKSHGVDSGSVVTEDHEQERGSNDIETSGATKNILFSARDWARWNSDPDAAAFLDRDWWATMDIEGKIVLSRFSWAKVCACVLWLRCVPAWCGYFMYLGKSCSVLVLLQ